MADVKIGDITPQATEVFTTDVIVGNVAEFGGASRDIPISALRRTDGNHDIESISNAVRFLTGGAVKGQFDQAGDFLVNLGDLIFGTAGKGIDFGTSVFDDYEVGTWTATPVFSGVNTPTLLQQLGYYTKIGSLVVAQVRLIFKVSLSTGTLTITGLPFVSQTGTNIIYPVTLRPEGVGAANEIIGGYTLTGSSIITLERYTQSTGLLALLTDAQMHASNNITLDLRAIYNAA